MARSTLIDELQKKNQAPDLSGVNLQGVNLPQTLMMSAPDFSNQGSRLSSIGSAIGSAIDTGQNIGRVVSAPVLGAVDYIASPERPSFGSAVAERAQPQGGGAPTIFPPTLAPQAQQATQMQPTAPVQAQQPSITPPAQTAPQAPSLPYSPSMGGTGGTITRDLTGETFFAGREGLSRLSPESAQVYSDTSNQRHNEARQYRLANPEYAAQFSSQTPVSSEAQANIAAGRPPNVSEGMVRQAEAAMDQLNQELALRPMQDEVAKAREAIDTARFFRRPVTPDMERNLAQAQAKLDQASTDNRTPEQTESQRLDVERKRQIVAQGQQPNATPEQKKASARQQAVEAGTITQAQADEANKRDLIGNPPSGYETWAQYESETGTDADGDGKVATKAEAAQAGASPTIDPAELSGQDRAAYEWAQANPNDPRSVEILERLSK